MNHITEFQPIPNTSGQITMSSREIAELTNKQHRNVKRDIEVMLRELKKDVLSFERIYFDSMNRQQTEYRLDRELTETLITGYSITLRNRVIKRLHELEASRQPAIPDFTNPAESARAWADQFEQRQILQIENQQQAKKIASLENLFKEGMTIPQFCKGLNGVNVMAVNACLESRNWLYNESKTGTRWRAASYARDRYLTEHQSAISPHGKEPFTRFTPILLRKGAIRLHQLYLAGELPMKDSWDGVFTHDKAVRSAA